MDRIHARALTALAGAVFGVALLTSVALAAPPAAAPADSMPTRPGSLRFESTTYTTADGVAHPVELGRVSVPESRDRDSTHLIRLAFYRFRSTAKNPGSPIVFLAGGPGIPGTAMCVVPGYAALFERLREFGDVIVLDQRGTGLTEPLLSCRSNEPLPANAFESEASGLAAIRARLRTCAGQVRAKGIVLAAYNTNENADDVEDVRRALGAERIRLVATSYGTELALTLIRRHQGRIERAVLAGVRGPDKALKLPSVLDLQLRRVSDLVKADPRFKAFSLDMETVARQLMERLAQRPLSLTTTDRETGQKSSWRIGKFALQGVMQNDLSDGRAAASLPAMLYAMGQGDVSLFIGRVERLYAAMGTGTSAMTVAMDCASGASSERRATVLREAAASPLGNVRNMYQSPELCAEVGAADLGDRYRSRIYSKVPVLFLSGSMDPITPPFQAEEVRWGFPNGTHLVVENGFHETLPASEVQEVVAAYFRGEDVRGRRIELAPLRFLTIEEAKASR